MTASATPATQDSAKKSEKTYERAQIDWELIAKARAYAEGVHRQQFRKSYDKSAKVPYFVHLDGVANLLLEHHASTAEVCAGYLHDAVEDQGGLPRADDIEMFFGSHIREIVVALSDSLSEDPDNKKPWKQRKQKYIKHLKTAPTHVKRVSAADKINNMRQTIEDANNPEIGYRILSIFARNVKGDSLPKSERRNLTLWYHGEIGKVIAQHSKEIGSLADLYAETFQEFKATLNGFDLSKVDN